MHFRQSHEMASPIFALLRLLVRHHHSSKTDTQSDAYFAAPGAYDREKAWKLATLVLLLLGNGVKLLT
jgi:hypothetical protein